jgi:hypothetical protein
MKTSAEEERDYITFVWTMTSRSLVYRHQRFGRFMTQDSRRSFSAEDRFQTQANPRGI